MLMIAFTTRDRVSKCFCVEVVLARRKCPRDTSGKGESEGVKVLHAPPTSSYQRKQTVTQSVSVRVLTSESADLTVLNNDR